MKPKKILVVNDSKVIHKMFDVMLGDYNLIHAFSGKEGLKLLSSHDDIDLIFVDLPRSGMNSLGFIKSVRTDKHLMNTQIIILSNRGNKDDIIHGLHAGANNYLYKPFGDQDLLELIDRI